MPSSHRLGSSALLNLSLGRASFGFGCSGDLLRPAHRLTSDRLYAELKAIAGQLAELYRSHIATEDRTLIALGQRILSMAELAEISREMKRRGGLPRVARRS